MQLWVWVLFYLNSVRFGSRDCRWISKPNCTVSPLDKPFMRYFVLALEKCELGVYKTLQRSRYIHDSAVITVPTAFLPSFCAQK